jgi:hypothetical protein
MNLPEDVKRRLIVAGVLFGGLLVIVWINSSLMAGVSGVGSIITGWGILLFAAWPVALASLYWAAKGFFWIITGDTFDTENLSGWLIDWTRG